MKDVTVIIRFFFFLNKYAHLLLQMVIICMRRQQYLFVVKQVCPPATSTALAFISLYAIAILVNTVNVRSRYVDVDMHFPNMITLW